MGKSLSFLVAIVYTILLATVGLMSFDGSSVTTLEHSDKIFHFFAYALLCLLWYKALTIRFDVKKTLAIVFASVLALLIGMIIEVLQGVLTEDRSADFRDVIANVLGLSLTATILCFRNKFEVKK